MRRFNVRQLIFCALFAALIAVFSQVSLAIGPVPISLATLAVMLCGLLLGERMGCLAVLCYLLLGLVGAPVFSGLRGGASALLGATGGYLIGYLPYAALAGLGGKKGGLGRRFLFLLLGTAACYLLGTLWFMRQSGNSLAASLSLCVFPFLPGDAVKILLAAFLTPRLKKALRF